MRSITAQEIKNQFNIAIVISRFNESITQALYQGALDRLKELEFSEEQITSVWVPGAVEIPLTAQRLARMDAYEAIVCLGAVIKGETDHYDYVCRAASEGCQRVALESNVPVIFGVLTTLNVEQAKERIGGSKGHIGRNCIDSAFEMVSVLRQLG